MKTKILKLSTVVLLFAFISAGCQKDENSNAVLSGKWFFLGYGNDSTNEFEAEPADEPKSSYVIFENGELEGHSASNSYNMTYEVTGHDQLTILGGIKTYIGDTDWGIRFLRSLVFEEKITYNIIKNELYLYSTDSEFMKFKKE